MTCLIDQRQGGHFHFVDAADGGYAAAAANLKGWKPRARGGEQRTEAGRVWEARGSDIDEVDG
jgi:hypothetical protein